jgi:hypothetical protein
VDTLQVGQELTRGQQLTTANSYMLTLQSDGDLVLPGNTGTVWASGTDGKGAVRAALQDDRDLVVIASDGSANWASGTTTDSPQAAPEAAAPVVEEPAPAAPAAPAVQTCAVQGGDTLWAIAEGFCGDGNRYGEIASASGISNRTSSTRTGADDSVRFAGPRGQARCAVRPWKWFEMQERAGPFAGPARSARLVRAQASADLPVRAAGPFLASDRESRVALGVLTHVENLVVQVLGGGRFHDDLGTRRSRHHLVAIDRLTERQLQSGLAVLLGGQGEAQADAVVAAL